MSSRDFARRHALGVHVSQVAAGDPRREHLDLPGDHRIREVQAGVRCGLGLCRSRQSCYVDRAFGLSPRATLGLPILARVIDSGPERNGCDPAPSRQRSDGESRRDDRRVSNVTQPRAASARSLVSTTVHGLESQCASVRASISIDFLDDVLGPVPGVCFAGTAPAGGVSAEPTPYVAGPNAATDAIEFEFSHAWPQPECYVSKS